jgi:hypothetical protein
MPIIDGIQKDPQGTNHSYGYMSSMNYSPGGTTTLWADVTPGSGRITGDNDSARAQRGSITRQLRPTATSKAAA